MGSIYVLREICKGYALPRWKDKTGSQIPFFCVNGEMIRSPVLTGEKVTHSDVDESPLLHAGCIRYGV
jgi:hypothetical protein